MKARGFACRQAGFTLIETLIMITILGVVGAILTDIMTQIYRGQTKVVTTSQIKQSGQTTLDQIDKLIRFSDKVVCGGEDPLTDRIVIARGKLYTRLVFVGPTTDANGYIYFDYPDPNSVVEPCTQPPLADKVIITSTDPLSGISLEGKSNIRPEIFIKNYQAGFKDTVAVYFKAKPGVKLQNLPSNTTVNAVEFKTTIELR